MEGVGMLERWVLAVVSLVTSASPICRFPGTSRSGGVRPSSDPRVVSSCGTGATCVGLSEIHVRTLGDSFDLGLQWRGAEVASEPVGVQQLDLRAGRLGAAREQSLCLSPARVGGRIGAAEGLPGRAGRAPAIGGGLVREARGLRLAERDMGWAGAWS
jgi:hypothetical protein